MLSNALVVNSTIYSVKGMVVASIPTHRSLTASAKTSARRPDGTQYACSMHSSRRMRDAARYIWPSFSSWKASWRRDLVRSLRPTNKDIRLVVFMFSRSEIIEVHLLSPLERGNKLPGDLCKLLQIVALRKELDLSRRRERVTPDGVSVL